MLATFFAQLIPSTEVIEKADSVKTTFTQKLAQLSEMSGQDLLKTVASGLVNIVIKIVIALLIFWVGRWLIRRVRKMLDRIMERRKVDVSLRAFLRSLVTITLTLFLIIIIIGILGIDTTSFIALFASAGLAIGMALSGTLQNFAGGVMILLFRPFRVGDYIEAQNETGTVKEIRLIYTVLNTVDNKTILLPNGPVSTGIINNYSHEPLRRVDWVFGIGYGDDYDVAKATILELLAADERVKKEPEPFIALKELADSSVNIVVRAWVDSPEYWNVYYDMNERVYKEFPRRGLNAFPRQMAVHVHRPPEAGRTAAEEARAAQGTSVPCAARALGRETWIYPCLSAGLEGRTDFQPDCFRIETGNPIIMGIIPLRNPFKLQNGEPNTKRNGCFIGNTNRHPERRLNHYPSRPFRICIVINFFFGRSRDVIPEAQRNKRREIPVYQIHPTM